MMTLGIDISNAKFDVALLRQGKLKHKTFRNDSQGYQALLAWLTRQEALTAHVCLEATGIYGEPLVECLVDAGLVVSLERFCSDLRGNLLRRWGSEAGQGDVSRRGARWDGVEGRPTARIYAIGCWRRKAQQRRWRHALA
jgi:hypothetical protein